MSNSPTPEEWRGDGAGCAEWEREERSGDTERASSRSPGHLHEVEAREVGAGQLPFPSVPHLTRPALRRFEQLQRVPARGCHPPLPDWVEAGWPLRSSWLQTPSQQGYSQDGMACADGVSSLSPDTCSMHQELRGASSAGDVNMCICMDTMST